MKKIAVLLLLCLLCAAAASCSEDDTKYKELLSKAQESFDSHLSLQQGGLSIPSASSLPDGSTVITPFEGSDSIEEIGTPGMDYTVEAMELYLPVLGTATPDGWYLKGGSTLRLYSYDGEVLWETKIGTFLGASAFGAVTTDTSGKLLVLDKNGDTLWVDGNRPDSAVSTIATITHDGYVYAALRCLNGLVLRKYAPDGTLTAQKEYVTTENADVYVMKYVEGYGLVLSMSCRWMEEAEANFGILLLSDELTTKWAGYTDAIYYQNLAVADESLYVGSLGKTICLSLADGSITATAEGKLISVGSKIYLQEKQTALTVCDKALKPLSELSIAGQSAFRVEETEDGGLLVLTRNLLGMVPTPPEISAVWYEFEYVYTRYDKDGEILYRTVYATNEK